MIIPIIHTKSSIRPKIILFLGLTSLMLLVLILLSSGGMMINHYETLNLVLILILISQFIFALYFLLAKKYEDLGKILIEDDSFSVKTGKELVVYSISKMVDTRIFLNHYKNTTRRGIISIDKYDTGNFILFQYSGKTKIYEMLLKDRKQMDELLLIIKKHLPPDRLQIFED